MSWRSRSRRAVLPTPTSRDQPARAVRTPQVGCSSRSPRRCAGCPCLSEPQPHAAPTGCTTRPQCLRTWCRARLRTCQRVLAAAAIDATETVLDVGCGSGQVTRDAARCAAAGSAFGVDLSSRMIELARQQADGEQVANVAFHQADAQVHPFLDHRFLSSSAATVRCSSAMPQPRSPISRGPCALVGASSC
ncbi:MAG: class I SAM-dependent methyltransferase [Pseudonocardiaceae bacterium]